MYSRLVFFAVATILAASWVAASRDEWEVAYVPSDAPAAGPGETTSVEARKSRAKTRKKKRAKRSRRAEKARRNNMPKGWVWPPSNKMKGVGTACLSALDERGVSWRKGAAARKIATPIVLPDMEIGGLRLVSTYRKGPFVMDCHLALGLAAFAETLYGLGVRELHFSRIHDYTQVRVNGDVKRALSRHALGIAIDVRAFVDETGRKAVVLDDYPQGDELLLAIEQALNESGGFRTILTPGNDPASHDDHFHVEVGVDYTVSTRTSSL